MTSLVFCIGTDSVRMMRRGQWDRTEGVRSAVARNPAARSLITASGSTTHCPGPGPSGIAALPAPAQSHRFTHVVVYLRTILLHPTFAPSKYTFRAWLQNARIPPFGVFVISPAWLCDKRGNRTDGKDPVETGASPKGTLDEGDDEWTGTQIRRSSLSSNHFPSRA